MKKYIIVVLILLMVIISVLLKGNNELKEKPNSFDNHQENINYVDKVFKYDFIKENYSLEFLNWLDEKYPKAMEQIANLLDNNNFNESSWYDVTHNSIVVLKDLYNNAYENAFNVQIINNDKPEITLSFVGDVSLADNWSVMPKYDERKKGINGILTQEVLDIMTSSDVMVANNEFTVSTRGTPMSGKAFTFRADPSRLKIYKEMGVDLVTLANNHIYDFGKDAFMDMLVSLKENNIPYIGAGNNLNEAMEPYYFVVNGRKIAFVNATRAEKNIMTPGATQNEAGVLRCYDPENFIKAIKLAKANSDYVIALIHWGAESYHTLEDVQITTGKTYLESGADVIVGGHAHKLQGMEFYQNKLIAYNLGDFIFNDKTTETGILTVKINKNGELSYKFTPCLESNVYTDIMKNEEAINLLKQMEKWSINAQFLDDGTITVKE